MIDAAYTSLTDFPATVLTQAQRERWRVAMHAALGKYAEHQARLLAGLIKSDGDVSEGQPV
jgi:hypothetical protein